MNTIKTRTVGRTGLEVTEMGMGGAPLGDLFEPISETQAQNTLQAAWDVGIRYFDTAPFYGYGKSEHRFGHFLRQQTREEFAISTKVGRVLKATRDLKTFDKDMWADGLPFEHAFDYSYDGIMRSYEDSLQRLSLHAVELLLIHDLDYFFHTTEDMVTASLAQIYTSGWRALDELRASGQIKGIGAGLNMMGLIPPVPGTWSISTSSSSPCPIPSSTRIPWTKNFQNAPNTAPTSSSAPYLPRAFSSQDPVEGALYAYETAPPEIMAKTRKIETICQSHNVPLPAAAIQFPLAHPSVAAIIPGALKPEYIHANIKNYQHPIPSDLWAELKSEGLLREDAPTPD